MAEKLLIALNCEKESAEKMLWQLQQEGLDISGYSISRSIENIRQVLGAPDCNVTILIVPYLLRDNQCITVKELDELRTMNENVFILQVIPDVLYGTDYVQGLFNIGLYNAIFDKDSTPEAFVKLIHSGGRSRREAKKYYGITSAAGVKESILEPAVDPVQMLKYLCNEENGELKERADYVRNRISSEMFATLINNMPEDIAEELKNIEGYGIFFGTELPDGSKIEPKIVEVEKEVVKEVVKKEISFVDVNEIIGVVAFTRRAGSSMIAMNLAAQLAQAEELTPTFVQLPGTDSEAYNTLGLMENMGVDYVSHIAEISDGHACGKELNLYSGINICVPNPYTDHRIENKWTPDMIYRLLLGLPKPVIIDLGTHYAEASYRQLIPAMKHIIVVVDYDAEFDMNDLQRIKNIKEDNPAVNISFVLNKCDNPQRFLEIVGNDFEVLDIPKIERKYFANQNDGLIVKNYGNSLLGLAKLAGYDYSNIIKDDNSTESDTKPKAFKISLKKNIVEGMKQRQTRKTESADNNNESFSNHGISVEIGVGGVGRGVGTTHTALMIAQALRSRYKIAVVEQNETGAFAAVYRKLHPNKNYLTVIPMFQYKGISFFPNCNYSYFSSQFRDDYDFVIVDFGNELCCTDFLRMGKKIVVASGAEWKINELKTFVSDIAKKSDGADRFNYLIPFLSTEQIGKVQEFCGMKKSTAGTYSVPYCSDWNNPPTEIYVIIDDIMGNINSERRHGRFKLF